MKDTHSDFVILAPLGSIDAGAEFTLKVRAGSGCHAELESALVAIRDSRGGELARSHLAPTQDGAFETGEITLRAPPAPGEHAYRALVFVGEREGAVKEIGALDFVIRVQAHRTQLSVWDVPSAILAGDPFKMKIGVKCSCGCNLGGQRVRIFDPSDREVRLARLGCAPWPHTEALYFSEVTITPPAEPGVYAIQIVTTEWDTPLPHARGATDMSVNCVSAPHCSVTIRLLGLEDQAPVPGATVVAHPFRTTTDAGGIAKVDVPVGKYNVLISAPRYLPTSSQIEVASNMAVTVELDSDETWKIEDEQFGSTVHAG